MLGTFIFQYEESEMTIDLYTYYQNRYNNTKPIRGRAEDVRPIGKRNRDWELIVKEVREDGEWFGAQLYDTKVAMYGPNGKAELRIDRWATPKTADFLSSHSPFCAVKRRNNIWVSVQGVGAVPILKDQVAKFQFQDGKYVPAEPIKLKQKVIDRKASAEIRKRIKGFIDYATTMLKLSDGWVRADTVAEWRSVNIQSHTFAGNVYENRNYVYNFGFDEDVRHILRGAKASRWMRSEASKYIAYCDSVRKTIELLSADDTDVWDRAMYCILMSLNSHEYRTVESTTYNTHLSSHSTLSLYDNRYPVDSIKRFTNTMLKQLDEVHTTRDVEVGCVRDNLVI
jgi:hypothetical protein